MAAGKSELKVKIVISPVCDVLTGLWVLAYPENFEDEAEFTGRVLKTLRPRLQAELKQFFDEDCYPGLGLLSLMDKDYAESVPAFLAALTAMPREELAAALLAFGRVFRNNPPLGDNLAELLDNRPLLVEYIERNMSVPSEKVASLADTLVNLEESRDSLLELIEHFWYVSLAPEVEKRAREQAEIKEKCEARINQSGEHRFVSSLTSLKLSEGSYEEVLLTPSSFCGGCSTVATENKGESALILAFGGGNEALKQAEKSDRVEENLDTEKLALVFNILGDKTRLEVVRALVERPHYGQELAKLLGISNATVSYHLSYLQKIHVVHLERIEHRVYWVLDIERLRTLLAQSSVVLLGQ
ncbi:MAG TPA: metalloregulator ArsR/SmtB family transcription factor [Chloroflexia bacterium]|nr:metalloregulator ArsR/SmtB family transcription factor [Chloroflexia bacterium]